MNKKINDFLFFALYLIKLPFNKVWEVFNWFFEELAFFNKSKNLAGFVFILAVFTFMFNQRVIAYTLLVFFLYLYTKSEWNIGYWKHLKRKKDEKQLKEESRIDKVEVENVETEDNKK